MYGINAGISQQITEHVPQITSPLNANPAPKITATINTTKAIPNTPAPVSPKPTIMFLNNFFIVY